MGIVKVAQFRVQKNKLGMCLKAINELAEKVDNSGPGEVIKGAYQKFDDNSFIKFMTFKNY